MFDRKSLAEINKFHYIIIMPNNSQDDANLFNDTFFNRFDRNIVNSAIIMEFISHFPSNLDEYLGKWPISSNSYNRDTNYNINFVYEQNVYGDFISHVRICSVGCIFILKEVKKETIDLIAANTKMPIVSLENTKAGNKNILPLKHSSINKVYKKWELTIYNTIKKYRYDIHKLEHLYMNNNKNIASGYIAPSIKFLDPLTIVINRIRGLYADVTGSLYITEPSTPETHEKKEIEADTEINKALKTLIAEKYLILILGYVIENSIDKKDIFTLNKVGLTIEDLQTFIKTRDWDLYLQIVSKIIENFDTLYFSTDIVLCMPSVNYPFIKSVMDQSGNNIIPQKIFKSIYDFNNYYGLIDYDMFSAKNEQKKELNIMAWGSFLRERGLESVTLSSLFLLYALDKRLPYIRTRNIPASGIYRIACDISKFSFYLGSSNKTPSFNNGMTTITSILKDYLTKNNTDLLKIIKEKGNRIKIISDMPVEWIDIDGLPLCLDKKVSRIPITPGNGLISHTNNLRSEYIINKENLKVLILNALNPADPLFKTCKFLFDQIHAYFSLLPNQAEYREINNKNDFFDSINECEPTILVFYGHGEYDSHKMMGKLVVGHDEIEAIEVEKLDWKPQIAILGACETQVLHGSYLNTANIFLGSGVISVLGTFFPVDAFNATSFISSLLRHLVNTLIGVSPDFFLHWDDIIQMTQRTHYLFDSLHSLQEYLKRRKKNLRDYSLNPLDLFFKYCAKNGIEFIDWYRYRDKIFLEAFKDIPVLYSAYKSLIENNLIIPYSLFYTSLGSPEYIQIERDEEKENLNIEEVMKHYSKSIGL